jgi:hypothetical protein
LGFGLFFFIAVENFVVLVSWPFLDPFAGRVLGAMFLGWGLLGFMGFKATTFEEVKIPLFSSLVWTLLGTIAFIWMIAVHPTVPVAAWIEMIIAAVFFILFLFSYLKAKG